MVLFWYSLSSVSLVLGVVPSTLSEPRLAQPSKTLLCWYFLNFCVHKTPLKQEAMIPLVPQFSSQAQIQPRDQASMNKCCWSLTLSWSQLTAGEWRLSLCREILRVWTILILDHRRPMEAACWGGTEGPLGSLISGFSLSFRGFW